MGTGGLERVEIVGWTDQARDVESNGEPFMAPSGCVIRMAIGGGSKGGRSITLDRPLQVSFSCREENTSSKATGTWKWRVESLCPGRAVRRDAIAIGAVVAVQVA